MQGTIEMCIEIRGARHGKCNHLLWIHGKPCVQYIIICLIQWLFHYHPNKAVLHRITILLTKQLLQPKTKCCSKAPAQLLDQEWTLSPRDPGVLKSRMPCVCVTFGSQKCHEIHCHGHTIEVSWHGWDRGFADDGVDVVCKKIVPTRWFPNSKWTDGLWMFCNKQFLFAPRRFPDNNLQRGITLSTDKEAATKPSNFLKHAKAPAIVYRTSLHDMSYTSQFNTIHIIYNYTITHTPSSSLNFLTAFFLRTSRFSS